MFWECFTAICFLSHKRVEKSNLLTAWKPRGQVSISSLLVLSWIQHVPKNTTGNTSAYSFSFKKVHLAMFMFIIHCMILFPIKIDHDSWSEQMAVILASLQSAPVQHVLLCSGSCVQLGSKFMTLLSGNLPLLSAVVHTYANYFFFFCKKENLLYSLSNLQRKYNHKWNSFSRSQDRFFQLPQWPKSIHMWPIVHLWRRYGYVIKSISTETDIYYLWKVGG